MRSKKIIISLLLSGIVGAIVLFDGSFLTKKYLEPWDESYSHLIFDRRLKVVSKGLLAPNAYNQQPWEIHLDNNSFENFTLYTDTSRLMPISDPFSRQATMSQGAFLESVRIGASVSGYDTKIALFPMGEYDKSGSIESIKTHPIADVKVVLSDDGIDPLYQSMNQGVSNSPILDTPLTNQELKSLLSVNEENELTVLIFKHKNDVDEIREITINAMAIDLKTTLADEVKTFQFTEWDKNEHRDGLIFNPLSFSLPEQIITQAMNKIIPSSELDLLDISLNRFKAFVEDVPSYFLILSQGNSRSMQVKAGMLYARLVYTSQKLGLAIQPSDQALQSYPEMKEMHQLIHQKYAMFGQTIQMLASIGKPSRSLSFDARRDVKNLIVN